MKCKISDCFNCPYPDCINDKPLPEITAERRERSNRFHAQKEAWCREHGICTRCMHRPATEGHKTCQECRNKIARERTKYNHEVKNRKPKWELDGYQWCARCGKYPPKEGHKICERCYATNVSNLKAHGKQMHNSFSKAIETYWNNRQGVNNDGK